MTSPIFVKPMTALGDFFDSACTQVATMLADPTVATRTTTRVDTKSGHARRVR